MFLIHAGIEVFQSESRVSSLQETKTTFDKIVGIYSSMELSCQVSNQMLGITIETVNRVRKSSYKNNSTITIPNDFHGVLLL